MTGSSDPVALFVCRGSPYWGLGLDCYDLARDARTYKGSELVIAHPPCRSWGRYKHVARPRDGEKQLALWAMDLVRKNGGVLEHPASSSLWSHLQPGDCTVLIRQADFGHRAEKLTRLFFAGLGRMPPLPPANLGPFVLVEHLCRQERERTPPALAQWLLTWCRS